MGNTVKRQVLPSNSSPLSQKPQLTRHVVPNHLISDDIQAKSHPNHGYADNRIKTTKYTVLSFIPKNLFEQFHRIANLYFLFIVLLNWVPQVNAFGKEVAMIPVLFVLSVTGVKDAFEDYRRYRSDRDINHLKARSYSKSERRYVKTEWQHIHVGDIVHLSCDEVIPADVILLRSSDVTGVCHIDTANLDGETNLKQREVIKGLNCQGEEFHPTLFTHKIECELPNMEIYKFNGTMLTQLGEQIAVSKNNLLLRGCVLRNTDFVEGIVVYAGHETKAMLNNRGPRYKRSQLERQINRDVVWCVILLLLMCLLCSMGTGLFLSSFYDLMLVPFISFETIMQYTPALQGFIRFWTYIILFQVMIPLSLYVTIELVKLGQVYFITNDLDLYHTPTNSRVQCRALNITEDLGQVEVIFSDKTGTLTENQMVFKKCTIGGVDYSETKGDGEGGDLGLGNLSTSVSTQMDDTFNVNPALQKALSSMHIFSALHKESPLTPQMAPQHLQYIWDFFLLLAVCNTAVVSSGQHIDEMDASGILRESTKEAQEKNVSKNPSKQEKVASCEKPKPPPKRFQDYLPSSSKSTMSSVFARSSNHQPLDSESDSENDASMDIVSSSPGVVSCGQIELSQTATKIPRPKNLLFTPAASMSSCASSPYTSVSALSEATLKMRYEAESPDELALVKAACTYGCRLLRRSPEKVSVWLPGEGQVTFKILNILHFDSSRKRMSVILEHPVTNEIILYCKGADSAIFSCLKSYQPDDIATQELHHNTQAHLTEYSRQGLRTLCMARRIIPPQEYQVWMKRHNVAENALENRELLLTESASVIENDLELLGATGIEDRLQDGVPETIAALRNAGISIWVLTGDKQETALNIAYSCQLISFDQQVLVLNARNRQMATDIIASKLEYLETIAQSECTADKPPTPFHPASGDPAMPDISVLPPGEQRQHHKPPSSHKVALVIDGKTLGYALDKRLEKDFLKLAQQCHSVLCCRTTPHQKAAVVKLVRDTLHKQTLAIGDGANDVSMIQTADVGVGICGQEGMQAVMASDFALPRFRFLRKLLLVHGHWCYDRLARMTLYMWFKNAVFIFMLLWYQLYSGFSGSTPLDDFNLILFNLVYTSLPPIVLGIFDQDVSADTLIAQPSLYKQGPNKEVYKKHSYFICILDALWQSLMEFYIPYFVYKGSTVGLWEFGVTCNAGVVWASLLHICIETKSWHMYHWLVILLSLIIFYVFNIIFGWLCRTCTHPANPYNVAWRVFQTPDHWLAVILIVVLALLPRLTIRGLQGNLMPSSSIVARYWEQKLSQWQYTCRWSSTSSNSLVLLKYRHHPPDGDTS